MDLGLPQPVAAKVLRNMFMENKILVFVPSESKMSPRLSMKRLLGIPVFLRGILTLSEAGYKNFILVVPHSERRHVIKSWEHHVTNPTIKPHFIWTQNNHQLDDAAFDEILACSTESLTFLNANLLLTKNVLNSWEQIKLRNGQHLEAVIDRGLPPLTRFKLADIVKVKEQLPKTAFTAEDVVRFLLKRTSANSASLSWNEPTFLVTGFTPKNEATKFLTEQIRLGTNAWVARNINKRISLPVSVMLARLRVSPNSITILNMLIGLGAAIGAAGRTYTGLLIGAALFQLASIVDGCDGEVAKLRHRCTKFGQYIDSISDNLALAGFITGLMIHEYRVNDHTPFAFVWGGFLLIGLFILLGIMIRFLKKNTNSASFVTFDKEYLQKLSGNYPKPIVFLLKYGKYTLKKDFFSLLFLVFAIFGILPAMFYIAALGVWIGVGVLTYLNLKGTK